MPEVPTCPGCGKTFLGPKGWAKRRGHMGWCEPYLKSIGKLEKSQEKEHVKVPVSKVQGTNRYRDAEGHFAHPPSPEPDTPKPPVNPSPSEASPEGIPPTTPAVTLVIPPGPFSVPQGRESSGGASEPPQVGGGVLGATASAAYPQPEGGRESGTVEGRRDPTGPVSGGAAANPAPGQPETMTFAAGPEAPPSAEPPKVQVSEQPQMSESELTDFFEMVVGVRINDVVDRSKAAGGAVADPWERLRWRRSDSEAMAKVTKGLISKYGWDNLLAKFLAYAPEIQAVVVLGGLAWAKIGAALEIRRMRKAGVEGGGAGGPEEPRFGRPGGPSEEWAEDMWKKYKGGQL